MRRRLATLAVLLAAACSNPCGDSDATARKHQLARLRDARPAERIVAIHLLAEGADRETLTAIARAARDAPENVRREIATSIGKSNLPEAIDLVGALLQDRDDSVRAAAVRALSAKAGERAAAYIVSAYEPGGPLTRAAVSESAPDVFRRAVATEAGNWRRSVESRRKDGHMQIRVTALAEQGRDSTEPIVAELTARLVDPDPNTAAAAAAGLLNAGAVDQRPALIAALRSSPPLVVGAVAIALRGLGAEPAVDALIETLKRSNGEVASSILDALDGVTLTATARAALCKVAEAGSDVAITEHAALLAGKDCALPAGLPADPDDAGERLMVLLVLDRKDAEAVRRSRELLNDANAGVAAAAAAYLGRFGESADGDKLIDAARAQLGKVADARKNADEVERKKREPPPRPKQPSIFDMLGGANKDEKPDEPKKPKELNALEKLLALRKAPGPAGPVEDRPGAIGFIAQAAVAGARLGADSDELIRELVLDPESSIRIIAADLADLGGEKEEEQRAQIRENPDNELRIRMALLDYASKRPGAMDRITQLVPKLDAPHRADVASALASDAAEVRPLMLQLLAGEDVASPIAAGAVASLPGEDIDKALIQCMNASVPVGRYAALNALADRKGALIDQAVADAAVHPSPELREAATAALVKRHACSVSTRLAPLAADYSGAVRASVARLEAACGGK